MSFQRPSVYSLTAHGLYCPRTTACTAFYQELISLNDGVLQILSLEEDKNSRMHQESLRCRSVLQATFLNTVAKNSLSLQSEVLQSTVRL